MIRKFYDCCSVSRCTLVIGFRAGYCRPSQGHADKAVATVKADKAKALNEFNNGTGGFLQGDLYVFCDISAMARSSLSPIQTRRI